MTDEPRDDQPVTEDPPPTEPNRAPDAVKDPNEKTDGKPGMPSGGEEADPGGG